MIVKLIGGVLVVAAFFFGTLFVTDRLYRNAEPQRPTVLAQKPPLPPATRQSVIIAPAAFAIPAIRDAMDRAAPRSLSGKPDNPLSKLLAKAEIGFTMERTPLALSGQPDGLTIATTLNGSLRITGQIAGQLSGLGGALTGLINDNLGRGVKDASGRVLDQRADIKGHVAITSRPAITTGWRLEPNLTAQVNVAEANISIAGVKLNSAGEIKPLLDRAVAEQMSALQARLRNDAFLETAARREWGKMCRAIPLGAGGAGLPALWLEFRPTRAFAAQPRIDTGNVTLTLGVQADTRIVPQQTKPDCPFPSKLELVPPMDQGRVAIGVPIDVPFTDVSRLMEAQLKDRTFPDDGSGPVDVTVLRAHVSAAGDRLLISLLVKAREKQSWFGFGSEATIHVWGRPVLDSAQQTMQLADISLAVESEATFGLLGAAAKTAMPTLQAALAKNAAIDLKPFLANARRSIEKALAGFRQKNDSVRVDATLTGLRLVGIEFDSEILRITAEADGSARALVVRF